MHNGFAFYRGNLRSVSQHHHHAVEMVISEGPCEFWNGSERLHRGRVALLGADVPHRFVGNGWQWFVYVEPESRLGWNLAQCLNGQPVLSLSDELVADLPVAEAATTGELTLLFGRLIRRLMPDVVPALAVNVDERIDSVLDYVKTHIDDPLPLGQLTEIACLSEGRLMHLFKEQVGIPIRKYILWSRLQVSVKHVLQGQNLTGAAHSGGFADSAHFSRTFSEMFGIRPSDVLLK
ncbi:AraC-like DNA-binding protein [Spirosoma lacussanchae]